MAIAKFGVLIVDARGTIGGVVFTANKAGPYLKLWAAAVNPQSPLQTAQRAKISTAAQAWQALSSANRDLWDTYAALPAQDLTNSLGETYSISGFLWFVRISSNLASAGESPRDQPPTLAIPIAPTVLDAFLKTDTAPTESRLDMDPEQADDTRFHVVTARLFNSEGRIAGFANLSNIIVHPHSTPAVSKLTLTATADDESLGLASNAVDGDLGTVWGALASSMPHWWQGNIATSDRDVHHYRLNTGTIGGSGLTGPNTWVFQYWNGAWVTADTVTGFTTLDDTWHSFDIDLPFVTTSDQWRIFISANNGSAALGFAEFEIYGFDPAVPLPINFQTELQTRLGTVQLGQKAFYQVRDQNAHGRRGAPTSITALAEDS